MPSSKKSSKPKKSYKPIKNTWAQSQKNHTNLEIKHRKIIKEYCTKQNQYCTQTKLSKRKIDFNPKIKWIQSLTKYPQNWANPAQSLNHTTQSKTSQPLSKPSNQQSTNPQPNKNTASTIPTKKHQNKPTLQPTTNRT